MLRPLGPSARLILSAQPACKTAMIQPLGNSYFSFYLFLSNYNFIKKKLFFTVRLHTHCFSGIKTISHYISIHKYILLLHINLVYKVNVIIANRKEDPVSTHPYLRPHHSKSTSRPKSKPTLLIG